jgi:hypothetical protein
MGRRFYEAPQMLHYGGKMLKSFTMVSLLLVLSFTAQARSRAGNFPLGPNPQMTPGALCTHPTAYRYAEHIPYCDRSVGGGLKRQIIQDYDSKLGFSIQKMPRGDFKIDHFIPLSIGGANEVTNLWPQHKSVYSFSDPLESDVSNLMVAGKIKQADAVRVIRECKLDLGKCKELGAYLKKLY